MTDRQDAKEKIRKLVEKYHANKSIALKMSESDTRQKYIDKLFKALGWDVDGDEISDEVIREEGIKFKEAGKKKADYTFRLNGITKFVVEAKAIKEDLEKEEFKYQAISYAYNKACSWAVLTDFHGVKVWFVDEESKTPFLNIDLGDLNSFEDNFEKLWRYLSKEGVLKNNLDEEAISRGYKKRKTPIDQQLFSDLKMWRGMLSSNIGKLNTDKNLSEDDIEEAVQRIIDRLIFIRKTEDAGMEEIQLKTIIRSHKANFYNEIKRLFARFNEDYNSKLFGDNKNDKHLCDEISVSDDLIEEIINGLYKPKDSKIEYNFDAIDADILGNIYEQYLSFIMSRAGRGIKLSGGKAHRKEQGIYYTPTYIVDYIVRNTLGELLKDKKIDLDKIKVLDPACGSGSFLIRAFDLLYEYHKKKEGKQTSLRSLDEGSFKRKVKILKNNIFGVDLDSKAVEIAQLNLLLKALEKKQRLPTLKDNIKCGNSLIDDEKIAKDKSFKWDERFPDVIQYDNNGKLKEGCGFDVIIGNPPYVRQEELSEIKPHLQQNYEVYHGMADLFVYFFEREMNTLKEGGYFGMIVSNKWLRAGYGINLRKFISKFWIEKFIDFGDLKVFPDATIYPCIILLRKINKTNPKIQVCKMETLSFDSLESYIKKDQFPVNQKELGEKEWNIQNAEANQVLKKIMSSGVELEKYCCRKINYGIKTGLNEAFVIDEKIRDELIAEDQKSAEIIKPILSGSEIKRYGIFPKSKYLIFTRRGIEINKYPAIKKHLKKFEAELTPKTSSSQKIGRKPGDYKWYEIQDVIAYYKEFEKQKILWGNLVTKASFYFDEQGFYVNAPGCILPTDSKYVLGILNSKVMSYFLKSICAERQGGFIEQKPVYISKIPIKDVPKSQQQPIIKLVDKMLSRNKRLNEIGDKKTDERARIEEEIKRIDKEIDELVYHIYGIIKAEQEIIEKSLI